MKKLFLLLSLVVFMGLLLFNLQETPNQDVSSSDITLFEIGELASLADSEVCIEFCNHGSQGSCEFYGSGFRCYIGPWTPDCSGSRIECF